jgi:hypothetical protein
MSDLDEIEALAARQSKAAKEAAKYIPESVKTEEAGMFAGMGPMGSSFMAPSIGQGQKAEPFPEAKPQEETGELPKDFEQFVKRQEKASKIGKEFLPKEEQPKQAAQTDFPTIEAAKQSALSSIEDTAKGLYIDHTEPVQSYIASQLHNLSPSQITPEIKTEAAKVTDPEEIKQFPSWFPKTDEQHRAVFDQKHEDTNYGKEAWNVGVGIGKGLAESGVRFASGVAKTIPAFLQGPEDLTNREQWAQWGKNFLAPATSAAETFESVAKTAANAAANGLSVTDWIQQQIPKELGGISHDEAFDRYLRRQRADEYYEGWKKTDPNVFTRLILEDPNTRELAEKMAYGLTSVWSPSVDDRLERFGGDREAALKEKQIDDLRDSQQLISNFRKEASQMVPEADITEALSYGRAGLNPFDVYGKAFQALGQGAKAASRIGKTEAQLAEIDRAAVAKAFEQDLQKIKDSQKPGVFERGFGGLANAIEVGTEKTKGALEKIPEFIGVPASKLGEGLLGATTLKLGSAALQTPRLMESALAGGRLAAGAEGRFLAGAKAATEKAGELGMTPAAQKWLADKSIPAAKVLDWMAQNTVEMARGGVHGATLAAAVGILENKNPEEIADLMGQGVFFHVGGEVLGNMSGVSHARYEANQKRQRAGAAKWFDGLDGATKQHVTEFANWDNYVQSLKALTENAVGEHALAQQELVNAVNTGEPENKIAAAKEDADYTLRIAKTRRAMLQNAEKANAETRQMYADQIRIGLADLMTALNGSTTNRNVELRMTTTPQLVNEVLENNKDKGLTDLEKVEVVNHLLANSGQIAFEAENGGKHRLSSGKTIDLYTPYKERLNVNIDAVKRRMGTGESVLNAVGHEAGHSFWNSKEFREANAQTIKDLFGDQRFDERGNLISGDAGILSTEDLVNKFKNVYAKGVQGGWEHLAKLTGLWDVKTNDIDPAKTASYMKAEVMAELIQGGAQGGIKLGESPKPWLAPLVDWATVKNKNQKTVRSIRDAFGLTETKPWDSSVVGVTFSKDQVDATRKALKAVAELNGDINAAEIIPHAPITETQLKANEAVAKQFGDGFFATEKVATVVDENGNVVSSHVITDPGAMEGTFEHSTTDTGDSELRQTSGYGTVPPELHDVQLPKGGKLKITSRIKRDASGGLAALTPDQAKALGRERARIIREALESAPDKEYPGRMSATSADGLSFGGILSPEQVKAIKRLPETIIPYGLKRRILEFNDLLVRDEGEGMIGLYGQAMDRYGRYKSFAPKIVDFVPLGMKMSKDGNILFNMFSKTGMREKLRRWQRDTPELLNLWQGDGDAFMTDVRKVLDNWKPREGAPAGLPGETGLDSDSNIAIAKKNRVNDFLNIFRKTEPESLLANPARSTMKRPPRRLTKAEKLDEESSDPNTLIRSYRVDRFHDLERSSDAPFRVNYGKALYNLMPAKEEAMREREPRLKEPVGFGAGILKGLQAVSAEYDPNGTGEIKATVQPEAAQVRFMPAPADEEYHHAEGSFPKTETSQPYKMSAIHKISDDALLFADKMGGLAVPSVAVVKAGTGIQGFGNITLVGGRDLVDPKTNPVYSGDAYTQRFPKPEYPRVKTKKAQQTIDLFKPAQGKFSSSYGDNVTDIIWDNAVNRPNPEEAVNKLKKSNVAKATYLGDAAPEPVMRTVSQDLGILDTAPMKEWMSKNSIQDVNYNDIEGRKALGDAIRAGFDEVYPEEMKGKATRIGNRFVSEDGQATVGAISRLEADVRNYGKTEIDAAETQKALDQKLAGKESDFYKWVENTIEGMYEAPRIRVAGKWEPYTLENIARVMTSGKIAGVEKSMTQSTGLTAAQMAKRFGSLQEMRNTAEAPWGIRSEAEVNEARNKVSEVLRDYRDAMVPYYKGATWDALDESMAALGAYYRSGAGGESRMKQTLSKMGFTNVPSEVVKQAVSAADAMSASPVKYFEAKPQRIVQLNEFKGAIVPDNVDPEVLSTLERNGIETRIIPAEKADDSAYIGSEIDKLKGGIPQQEQAGIRFMPEREEDPTMVAPGFYSKAGRVLLDKMPNRASAEQLKGILDPQKGSGVKPDEMKWSGINQFIDSMQAEKGFVTKDDVKRFLKDSYAAKFETQTMKDGKEYFVTYSDGNTEHFSSKEEAEKARENGIENHIEMLNDYAGYDVILDESNDEDYTPKGWFIIDQNYDHVTREQKNSYGLTIFRPEEYYKTEEAARKDLNDYFRSLAEDETTISEGDVEDAQYSQYTLPGGTNYEEIVLRMPGVDYTSSHFPDVSNYVAHMRTADFGNGRLIEELQSDLHKEAREKGYERLPDTTGWKAYNFKYDSENPDASGWIVLSSNGRDLGTYGGRTEEEVIQKAASLSKEGIADAPFRKDWPLQLFKHALQKAVADGKQWVGWTGGEAQAERYDLSNKVSAVEYLPLTQTLLAFDLSGDEVFNQAVPREKIADYVGKEVAEKLLATEPYTIGSRKQVHALKGVDLKLGGEGMIGFYDTILPKEIGKYVKQWGAKVEKGGIPNPDKGMKGLAVGFDGTDYWLNEGSFGKRVPGVGPFKSYIEADDARNALSKGQEQIWKVNITPEMSESVSGGQARFMPSKTVAGKENDLTKEPVTEEQKQAQRQFVQSIVPANTMAKAKGIPSKIPDEYADKPFLPIMADLLGGGGQYKGVEMQGGPAYPVMNYDGNNMTAAWSSTREGVESILGDLVKTGSIWKDKNGKHWAIVSPFSMSQTAHQANKNFGRVFMKEVANAVNSGQVSPAAANALANEIRNIKGEKVSLSEFPDLNSPQMDEYFSGLSFESRAAIVKALTKKESQEMGVPISERTLRETRDASYHGIDSGNLLSMLLIDIDRMAKQVPVMEKQGRGKDAKEVDTGETKWKLRDDLSAADLGVPEHLTYNTVLPGKMIAHFQTPVPFDVGMPDPIRQIKEYVAENKPAKIQEAQGDLAAKEGILSNLQLKIGDKYQELTSAREGLAAAEKLLKRESAKNTPDKTKVAEYKASIKSLNSAISKILKKSPDIEKQMDDALEARRVAEKAVGTAERYDIRPDYAYQGRIPTGITAQKLNPQVMGSINEAQNLQTHPAVARAMAAAITDNWTAIAGQKTAGMTEFLHAIKRNEAAETLTQYDPSILKEDIKSGKMSLYTLPENDVWFGLKARKDGGKELVGVMNNSGLGGMLNLMMAKALQEGATNLDCYGVNIAGRNAELLPSLYARHGWVEYDRSPYDKQFLVAMPENATPEQKAQVEAARDKKEAALKAQWTAQGWDGQKMPDLVYMKHEGVRTKPVSNPTGSSILRGKVASSRRAASRASSQIRGAGGGEAGGQVSDSGAASGDSMGGGKLLARGIDTFVKELGTATPDQLRTLGITPELAKQILDAVTFGSKY